MRNLSKPQRILAALAIALGVVCTSACGQDVQKKTLSGIVATYQSALVAGKTMKSFHAQGKVSDENYRQFLHALNDARLVLREGVDAIEAIPEVDINNRVLLTTMLGRARDAFVRLANVGAFGLRNNPALAQQLSDIVKVGIDATLVVVNVLSAIKRPTKMPVVPDLQSSEIQSFLQASEVH